MKNAKPKSITSKQQTTSKIEKKDWKSCTPFKLHDDQPSCPLAHFANPNPGSTSSFRSYLHPTLI
jgi:hypothetical protein